MTVTDIKRLDNCNSVVHERTTLTRLHQLEVLTLPFKALEVMEKMEISKRAQRPKLR